MKRLYVCKKCKHQMDIDSAIGEDIGRIVQWCPTCHNLTDWVLTRDFYDFGIVNDKHVMKLV